MAANGLIRFCSYGLTVACLALTGCASTGGASKFAFWNRPQPAVAKNPVAAPPKNIKDPTKLHMTYARWQEQIGQMATAAESYNFVLQEDPKSVDAILGLARIDQLAGRTSVAEQGYLKALKIEPNGPNTLAALGQFYAAEQRWDESIDMLNAAMMAAPEDTMHRYQLAVALARSGDIDLAMPHFVKSVGDAEAHYNVGYILYQQGNLEASENHLLQAVVKRADLVEAQQMLDEVRRDRENQLMIADSMAPAVKQVNFPASSIPNSGQSWPVQQVNGQAEAALTGHPATASRPVKPSASANAAHARKSAPNLDRKPRQPQRESIVPPKSSAPPSRSSMSQQQLEQWQNQMGVDAIQNPWASRTE